jgi:hypothetical protein
MDAAKISLSAKELQLVTNADWILTKNHITEKVKELLALLLQQQQTLLKKNAFPLPKETAKSSPKISKGENYKGLPYLVLDYPRYFDKENIFAIRTLFWWGNFFSCTLHLSGRYKKDAAPKIISSRSVLLKNDFFICVSDDPWEHHFENDNYAGINKISKKDFEKIIREKSFIKLAQKIPLTQWDDAEKILLDSFKKILTLLKY